jgi:DNA repair ATPase RecN
MDSDRRIAEIARMLGGPAETALSHARTLLSIK